jgi:hypothetical protein
MIIKERYFMKKLFFGLTLFIIATIGTIYGVLFTKTGNDIIASYIENKVNTEQSDVKLKVNKFELTFNTITFNATIDDNSNIDVIGDLQLFKKVVDLKYNIKIKELSNLENLINQKLNGPFNTSGIFKGNERAALIEGISDIASSETTYKINLINFEPSDINFLVKNAKITDLLNLVNQPNYASGNIDIKGDIKNARANYLDGTIITNINNGKLINDVINKELNQNIASRIGFKSDINAKLIGDKIELKSDLITSLADVFASKSIINLNTNKITSDYKIDVKNLSKLQGVIGTKLNGKFILDGNLVFENGNLKIDGKSNIFESNTSYDFKLLNSSLQDVNFKIENAKIDKLLHMLNEPIYAVGDLKVQGNIPNANLNTLDGKINTTIENGKLINEVINTVFKQNFKKNVSFSGDLDTKLSSNKALTKAKIDTSIANLTTNELVFNFKDSSLISDYLLSVPSLEKLKDFTGAKLRGSLDISGDLSKKSGALVVNGNSDVIGGKLNFNLKNDDLKATLKDAQIKQLTHMLYYPEVFNSKTDLNLDYNLLLNKGKLSGNLLNGHFLPNDFSALVNQLAKFDLTREVYETVKINSDINNMVLSSVINMKSANTTIDVTNSVLDLNKDTIDAIVKGKIKTTDFGVNIKGSISKPKISLDTKGLIENQINKQLDKNQDKIKEKLDKVLKGKLGEEGSEKLLNNIKSLF